MPIRLGGLATGIDTESIIRETLKPIQTKIDKQYQIREMVAYKKEQYMSFNSKLVSLRTSLLDLKLSTTFTGKKAATTDETVLTATTLPGARNGTTDLKINSLATRVSVNSIEAIGSSADKTKIANQFGIDSEALISFTLKGKDGEVTLSSKAGNFSMDQIVNGINKANIGVTAFYDATIDRFFLQSSVYGTEAQLTVKQDGITGTNKGFLSDYLKLSGSNGFDYSKLNFPADSPVLRRIVNSEPIASSNPAGTTRISQLYGSNEKVPSNIYFTLEGPGGMESFSVASNMTLDDLASRISISTIGIAASYDQSTGTFSLAASPGTDPTRALIAVRRDYTSNSDRNGFLGDKLKLTMAGVSGHGCQVEYNGTDLTFSSNEFTMNNIKYNVRNVSSGKTVQVSVTSDVERAVDKIKKYVEAFNVIVDYISTTVNKKRAMADKYTPYLPLTDAQKEEMSDGEIKLWDAKWQQGLMRNESLIRASSAGIRMTSLDRLNDRVSANERGNTNTLVSQLKYRSLSAIGINTPTYSYGDETNGRLEIDETKLRAALEEDPDAVCDLFTLTQTKTVSGKTVTYNVGVAVNLYDQLTEKINQVTKKSGRANAIYDSSYMASEINRINVIIDKLQDRYTDQEDSLWNQYAKLEQAIASLNNQRADMQAKLGINQ